VDDTDLVVETDKYAFVPDYSVDSTDLIVSNGDLATISGEDLIKKSIIRKLKTHLGSYEILLKTYVSNNVETNSETISDIIAVKNGSNYGSKIGIILSEPINLRTIQLLKSKISESVNSDERISLKDVQVELKQDAGTILVTVTYELVSSGQTSTATAEISPTN